MERRGDGLDAQEELLNTDWVKLTLKKMLSLHPLIPPLPLLSTTPKF